MKVRLAESEKETRWLRTQNQSKDALIQEQAAEIQQLSSLVGGSVSEIAQQAMDAKLANALTEEVR